MAAPHVAGVASLLYSRKPSLTPAEVLAILQNTVTSFPGGSSCNTSICGSGIVNAGAAVAALGNPVPTITGLNPFFSYTGRSRIHAHRQRHGLCQWLGGAVERFEPNDDVCQQHTTDSGNHCRGYCHSRHSECHRIQPGAWWRRIEYGVIRRGQPCADCHRAQSVLGYTGRSRFHAHRQWHGVCQRRGGALERFEPSDDVCQQHTS